MRGISSRKPISPPTLNFPLLLLVFELTCFSFLSQMGDMFKNTFLEQDSNMDYDRQCPLYKTSWMIINFLLYYELALKALEEYKNLSWRDIQDLTQGSLNQLAKMKFKVCSKKFTLPH